MSKPQSVAAIEASVNSLVNYMNNLGIIPRQGMIMDRLSLGFFSKSVKLFRSILLLVEGGFYEEAYALARSSVELRFNARWIANKDSYTRSREFFYFGAKQSKYVHETASVYRVNHPAGLSQRLQDIAAQYKNHKEWTRVPLKERAYEPSAKVTDSDQPAAHFGQTYETVYWSMCSFCHVDIAALMYGRHLPRPGEEFKVSEHHEAERDGAEHHGITALIVSALSSLFAAQYGLEAMNMEMPEAVHACFLEALPGWKATRTSVPSE
jgi:hypothetical protein